MTRTPVPAHEDSIICICGSTRFADEMREANRQLTMKGWIVLAPGVFAHQGDSITKRDKRQLDILHLRKIRLSDAVYVVNVGGYIGASTRDEVVFALALGKPVYYLEDQR